MRIWDGYKGSSFLELLGNQVATAVANAHGTTCLGLRFVDGALVAGDRLATMGYQVA